MAFEVYLAPKPLYSLWLEVVHCTGPTPANPEFGYQTGPLVAHLLCARPCRVLGDPGPRGQRKPAMPPKPGTCPNPPILRPLGPFLNLAYPNSQVLVGLLGKPRP